MTTSIEDDLFADIDDSLVEIERLKKQATECAASDLTQIEESIVRCRNSIERCTSDLLRHKVDRKIVESYLEE